MNRSRLVLGLPLAASIILGACGGGAASGSDATAATSTGGSAPASTASQAAVAGPSDACALLATDEVAPVVPGPTTSGASDASGPVASSRCSWTTSEQGKIMALTVEVMDGYVSYLKDLGGDVGAIEKEILAEATDPDKPGRVVEGLGDVAAAWYDSYDNQVHVRFLKGDAQVGVQYVGDSGQDAEGKQDAVVELARAVAGRLP